MSAHFDHRLSLLDMPRRVKGPVALRPVVNHEGTIVGFWVQNQTAEADRVMSQLMGNTRWSLLDLKAAAILLGLGILEEGTLGNVLWC